jgi:hypothetical protein
MGQLKAQGRIEGWRLTWHRLGLGPPGVGKLDLMVEVRDLAQLESAFQLVAGLARGLFRCQFVAPECVVCGPPRLSRPVPPSR